MRLGLLVWLGWTVFASTASAQCVTFLAGAMPSTITAPPVSTITGTPTVSLALNFRYSSPGPCTIVPIVNATWIRPHPVDVSLVINNSAGDGQFSFLLDDNLSPTPRTTTVVVRDVTFTVTQLGYLPDCQRADFFPLGLKDLTRSLQPGVQREVVAMRVFNDGYAPCSVGFQNVPAWVRIAPVTVSYPGRRIEAAQYTIDVDPPIATQREAVLDFLDARLRIVQLPGPPVPTSVADPAFVTSANTPLSVPAPGVLANDNGNGGGAMTAELVASVPPAAGTLTLSANGAFIYTPAPGFTGAATFSYRARNAAGPGNAVVATISVADDPTRPSPPTALEVSNLAGNVVTLRWAAPTSGPAPTGYAIEGGVAPSQVLASVPTGSTAPTFTFVAPTGVFFIRVHALTGLQRSVASNEVQVFTAPAAPTPPADLLGLVDGSTLGLSWRNTFAGGAPTGLTLDVTGTLSGSIALPFSESVMFTGVPGGTYSMRLRATNTSGVSAPTPPVTLTFPSVCSGVPSSVARLTAYQVGRTLSVAWDPPVGGAAVSSYILTVTGSVTASLPTAVRALSGGVGPGTYVISVTALNACGVGPASPAQTVVVP